jgi:hypothetical protein
VSGCQRKWKHAICICRLRANTKSIYKRTVERDSHGSVTRSWHNAVACYNLSVGLGMVLLGLHCRSQLSVQILIYSAAYYSVPVFVRYVSSFQISWLSIITGWQFSECAVLEIFHAYIVYGCVLHYIWFSFWFDHIGSAVRHFVIFISWCVAISSGILRVTMSSTLEFTFTSSCRILMSFIASERRSTYVFSSLSFCLVRYTLTKVPYATFPSSLPASGITTPSLYLEIRHPHLQALSYLEQILNGS